jgi:hypothetical protein
VAEEVIHKNKNATLRKGTERKVSWEIRIVDSCLFLNGLLFVTRLNNGRMNRTRECLTAGWMIPGLGMTELC